MPSDLPEAPDMEPIEIEVTIRDDAYTHEEYTTSFMVTQRELEEDDPREMVRVATELTLDSALQQYLAAQRGTLDDG